MRPRLLSAGAAVAAAMLLAGPAATTGSAQSDPGGIAAGGASASSFFLTYYDTRTVFEGGTAGPPDVNIGFSTGDIDRSGSSVAIAALAYSPYVDLPPAVNALTPGPDLDYGPVLSRARASVTGQPPKDAVASLSTPTSLTDVGTAEAHLIEGPAIDAYTTLARLEPAPASHIKSATSRIRVRKVAGSAVTESTTLLRGVSIAGLLSFDSVSLTSVSVADGSAGTADAVVAIEGAAIAGTPIVLTETGFTIADQAVPVDLSAMKDALQQAGIELFGPGTITEEPGAERSLAVATGPKIRFRSPQDNTVEIVLGHAIAASTLLPGFVLPPLPTLPPVAPPPAPPVVDVGGPAFVPPAAPPAAPPVTTPGSAVVDLSKLVLSDARSVDGFAALYSAVAAGGILILGGLVLPRRRSLLEERLR